MASRNLPPSFFNAHYHNGAHLKAASHYVGSGELYGGEAAAAAGYSGLHQLAAQHHAAASPDPWQYAAQVNLIPIHFLSSHQRNVSHVSAQLAVTYTVAGNDKSQAEPGSLPHAVPLYMSNIQSLLPHLRYALPNSYRNSLLALSSNFTPV